MRTGRQSAALPACPAPPSPRHSNLRARRPVMQTVIAATVVSAFLVIALSINALVLRTMQAQIHLVSQPQASRSTDRGKKRQ